jgi:hypothetical protein
MTTIREKRTEGAKLRRKTDLSAGLAGKVRETARIGQNPKQRMIKDSDRLIPTRWTLHRASTAVQNREPWPEGS